MTKYTLEEFEAGLGEDTNEVVMCLECKEHTSVTYTLIGAFPDDVEEDEGLSTCCGAAYK